MDISITSIIFSTLNEYNMSKEKQYIRFVEPYRDSMNKIKIFYLCVNAINKQKHILNKYLTYNILIDAFKYDIMMILNGR